MNEVHYDRVFCLLQSALSLFFPPVIHSRIFPSTRAIGACNIINWQSHVKQKVRQYRSNNKSNRCTSAANGEDCLSVERIKEIIFRKYVCCSEVRDSPILL